MSKADSPTKFCTADGCDRPLRARGLCGTHYNRQARAEGKDYYATERVACTTCGVLTEKRVDPRRPVRFCSYACRDAWRVEQPDDPMWLPPSPAWRRPPALRKAKEPAQPRVLNCRRCTEAFVAAASAQRFCSKDCARKTDNERRYAERATRRTIRRLHIFERDGYVCWMCEERCDSSARVPQLNAPTIDHLVPRVHGGTHDEANLATACFACNSRRGAAWDLPGRHAA